MKKFTFSNGLLSKNNANNHVVVHLQSDTGMKVFADSGDAEAHADSLNAKAKDMGISARYEVRPIEDGTAMDKDGNPVEG